MSETERKILVIAAYGIDYFSSIVDEFQRQGCFVVKADSIKDARRCLGQNSFDSILINLEPDGKGGVHSIELVPFIKSHPKQQNAVCIGVSTMSPLALMKSNPRLQSSLSILNGWLTIPILAEETANLIVKSPEDVKEQHLHMGESKQVLIIATYGIDIFYGIVDELERNGFVVGKAASKNEALLALENQSYDSILLNMEPDGKGGVTGMELLPIIADHSLQKDAILLGVSMQSPVSLSASAAEHKKDMDIVAGWLTIPVLPKQTASIIIDVTRSPGQFSVKSRSSD